MVGDLAAAVGLYHRDAVRHARQVRRAPRDAERVDRRMLQQPELVGGSGGALSGEILHLAPRRGVFDTAEPAHAHLGSELARAGGGWVRRRRRCWLRSWRFWQDTGNGSTTTRAWRRRCAGEA